MESIKLLLLVGFIRMLHALVNQIEPYILGILFLLF